MGTLENTWFMLEQGRIDFMHDDDLIIFLLDMFEIYFIDSPVVVKKYRHILAKDFPSKMKVDMEVEGKSSKYMQSRSSFMMYFDAYLLIHKV